MCFINVSAFASVRGAFLNTPTGPSRTIFNFRPTSQQTQTPRPYPVQNVNDQNGAQGLPQPTTFFNQGTSKFTISRNRLFKSNYIF